MYHVPSIITSMHMHTHTLPLPTHTLHSYEEAARYLETYKVFENKPPDLLMERMDSDHSSRVS